jgi:lysophospholipase L1-like esterase
MMTNGVAVIAAALLLLGSSSPPASASAVDSSTMPLSARVTCVRPSGHWSADGVWLVGGADAHVNDDCDAGFSTPPSWPAVAHELGRTARDPLVVAVGDSITWGVGTAHPGRQGWPGRIGAQRVAHISGCLVNSCWHQLPAVDTWRRQVLVLHPDVVIVAYGFNDLVGSRSRRIMIGLRRVLRMDTGHGITTYVATLTPLHPGHALEPFRADLNARIRRVFGAELIDFDDALAVDGVLPIEYDSGDGLHPNAAGYRVMAHVARWTLTCRDAMVRDSAPCPLADVA